jgi:hypothetical protein
LQSQKSELENLILLLVIFRPLKNIITQDNQQVITKQDNQQVITKQMCVKTIQQTQSIVGQHIDPQDNPPMSQIKVVESKQMCVKTIKQTQSIVGQHIDPQDNPPMSQIKVVESKPCDIMALLPNRLIMDIIQMADGGLNTHKKKFSNVMLELDYCVWNNTGGEYRYNLGIRCNAGPYDNTHYLDLRPPTHTINSQATNMEIGCMWYNQAVTNPYLKAHKFQNSDNPRDWTDPTLLIDVEIDMIEVANYPEKIRRHSSQKQLDLYTWLWGSDILLDY